MTDLEDKILKKNIPGKYTWWDKDRYDFGSAADCLEIVSVTGPLFGCLFSSPGAFLQYNLRS